MKETDIIALQKNSNGKNMYLVNVGMFYHAYDSAAFAIAKLMHYKVKRKHRRCGDVLISGFPVNQLLKVLNTIEKNGGKIFNRNDDIIKFADIDNSVDESLIEEKVETKAVNATSNDSLLKATVADFDLTNSTPIDAMNFVSNLKLMIKEK